VSAYFLVFGLLFTFLAAVAVTRFPQSRVVSELSEVPWAGRAVQRLRGLYLPPPANRIEIAPSKNADDGRPVETLFVGIGAHLRVAPERRAPLVRKTRRLGEYAVLARRAPNWVQLELPGLPEAAVWLDLDEPRDSTPPLGEEPAATMPLEARRAEARLLAAARRAMRGATWEQQRFGYPWISDVEDLDLLERLAGLLEDIEALYAARFGLEPIGQPAETIVLFLRESDYRAFQSEVDGLEDLAPGVSTGHAADGMAALFVGARPEAEVAATLVHEVAHLLNRRALGPALPLWLDEGIAEDFAYFSGPGSRPLAGYRQQSGNQIRIWGPLAGLQLLVTEEADLSLERLTHFTADLFVRSPDALALYSQSGFFVRFLLSPSEAEGAEMSGVSAAGAASPDPEAFRSFLRAVGRGGPASLESLLGELDGNTSGQERWTAATLQQRFSESLAALWSATPGLEPLETARAGV
jgi:hypothetical protein